MSVRDGVSVSVGIEVADAIGNAVGVLLDCAQALIAIHKHRMKTLFMKYLSMKLLFLLC